MWSTAASWAALLALAAALTRYYNPELFDKLTQQALPQPESTPAQKTAEKRPKTKRTHANRVDPKSGTSTPTSAAEGVAHKRRKLVSTPVEKPATPSAASVKQPELAEEDDASISNKDFAQRLAKAQTGTSLELPKAKGTTKRERRAAKKVQGERSGLEASGVSTTSSTTGDRDGDEDDDFSPVGSPSSGPVSTAPTSRADDVSDMLEAPAAKPTTLRLTDIKEKVQNGPKAASNKFEPVLSKKQRQRQAKQAEQKALREESDRIHDAKKQQQLRTARVAAGTSNQIKSDSFTAKQNAWQSGKPSSVEADASQTAEVHNAPLLDTFDHETAPAAKVNGAVSSEPLSDIATSAPKALSVNQVRQEQGDNKTSALAASSREKLSRPALQAKASWADQVNQEEQDNWASELVQEEKWESVTSKKGKKKGKKDVDTSSEASLSITKPAPAANKVLTNGSKAGNGVAQPKAGSVNRFATIEDNGDSSFRDAEWEA